MDSARHLLLRVLPIAILGWAAAALLQKSRPLSPEPVEKETVVCVLALRGWHSPVMEYSAGFQQELLRRLQQETPWAFAVTACPVTDSLPEADLTVLPPSACPGFPSDCFISQVLPDSTVWVIPTKNESLVRTVRAWSGEFFADAEFGELRDRFTPSFDPFSRTGDAPAGRLGPYDSLLKEYAARIGWDWRLLAALAWKESKFHIEVRSAAGAEGLMQMMPGTARRHRAENMLDPEESIRAATDYIRRLQGMFAGEAADRQELTNFVLVAYNAGEGRVRDLIRQAESLGRPHERWADLEALLPAVRGDAAEPAEGDEDDGPADPEEIAGGFQGHETVRFLADVMALYDRFRSLVP